MKIQSITITLFATAALFLSGCSNNAGTGAVIGSLVGAGLGKSTSNHHDKRALIGAALGGIVGGAIGSERDRAIRERATIETDPYYNKPVATTTSYSDEPVSSNGNVTHTHKYESGDRTHTHKGGAVKHTHASQEVVTNTEVVYVEDPYPVRSTVIIDAGFYDYPRQRYYPDRHRYRHHNRHYRYNRHRGHYRNRHRY
jgi:surface antigen